MSEALDGATTALQRRIEELTAELAEAMRSGEVVAGLLATERAAREQAEAALQRERMSGAKSYTRAEENERKWLSTEQDRQQAERERDTALARAGSAETELAVVRRRGTPSGHVVALEAELLSTLDHEKTAERLLGEERLAKVAAETALASARAVIEEAYHYQNRMPTDFVLRARAWLTSHPSPAPQKP